MLSNKLPNFIVAGCIKGGTSSLHSYLAEHPDIFVSKLKETNYFISSSVGLKYTYTLGSNVTINTRAVRTIEEYSALFGSVGAEAAIGEVSPLYLYYAQDIADQIFNTLENSKVILILRNPIDRAYSSFMHARRDGAEPIEDFSLALSMEDTRKKDGWEPLFYYKSLGRYADSVQAFLDCFGDNSVFVGFYDDLVSNPNVLLSSIYAFLGVDDSFKPDFSVRLNRSGTPRSGLLNFLANNNRFKAVVKPLLGRNFRREIKNKVNNVNLRASSMNASTRDMLAKYFESDIKALETKLGRDLSHWLIK